MAWQQVGHGAGSEARRSVGGVGAGGDRQGPAGLGVWTACAQVAPLPSPPARPESPWAGLA